MADNNTSTSLRGKKRTVASRESEDSVTSRESTSQKIISIEESDDESLHALLDKFTQKLSKYNKK